MEFLWPTLLLVAGFSLALLEVFVPSGGILGAVSAGAVITSIGMAFYSLGPGYGLGFSVVAVISLPIVIAIGFRLLPSTPLGRKLVPGLPTEDEVLPMPERRAQMRQLVGKTGIAKTAMMPSGAILVEGILCDAMSQGMAIEQGDPVKVVEVSGGWLVVRPLDKEERRSTSSNSAESLLDRPLEELGLEDLNDLDEPLR